MAMRLERVEAGDGWLIIEQTGPPIGEEQNGLVMVQTIAMAWRETQEEAQQEAKRRNGLDHNRHFFVLSEAQYEAAEV
jgi:hypothetical protein